MPFSMFEAPVNAEWPPLFAANGHCVRRDSSTSVETSRAFSGRNTQCELTSACCCDQYALLNSAYPVSPSKRTLEPKIRLRVVHCIVRRRPHLSMIEGTYCCCTTTETRPLSQSRRSRKRGCIDAIFQQCLSDIEVRGLEAL